MSEIVTGTDSRAYIGPIATRETFNTLAAFQAGGVIYVEIGMLESVGERGDSSSEVTGNVINEGRTRKGKGVRNGGNMPIVVFEDSEDAGQVAMKAAEKTSNKYAMKIEKANGDLEFMRVLVMSAKKNQLASDSLNRITFDCGIDSEIFEV